MTTVREACERFLAQFEASPARVAVVEAMLAKACAAFGNAGLAELDPAAIAQWRRSMPAPTRWQATQALRQVSRWAAREALAPRDSLAHLRNPRPVAEEVRPFASWDEVEAVAACLPEECSLLPVLGAGCGLRPGEILGLCWEEVDLDRRVLHVVRALGEGGELRRTLKTRRSRRAVPIRRRVAGHLERAPAAERAGLLVCGPAGGPADLRNLRRRAWRPALAAAGIDHPHRIYDLRHTYATWALRAGVSTFQLARRMGTSVEMIDLTYGHLTADAAELELSLLDAWDGS